MRRLAIFFVIAATAFAQTHRAKSVDIRILSTMLADDDGIQTHLTEALEQSILTLAAEFWVEHCK